MPIIEGLIAGNGIEAILAGLTEPQVAALAGALVNMVAPEVKKETKVLLDKLEPSIKKLMDNVARLGVDLAVKDWMTSNATKAIDLQPGIGNQ